MKKILYGFILFIALKSVKAQDFNHYQPLTSKGELPKDFTDRTSLKAAENIEKNIDNSDSYVDRKKKSNFLLKANYMLDELLMSGRVLFGDTVSKYVNQVADNLLKSDPELRNELRFYCLKSNVTNAFSTNQGMIFVTLGLIAQLENEAQLAQVLAHEIVHYKRKHVINTFIESSKIAKKQGEYKYNSYDDDIIRLSNYSKKLEFEADSMGFYWIREAGYSIKEALNVFDVLQFSYLPIDEHPFEYVDFETEVVKIPEGLKLDTIVSINFDDDYDDTKSTHPNIRKRREQITRLIQDKKGGKRYIQSKELFKHVRNICRFEGVRLSNKSADYVKAIYNAQVLQEEYPESDFLKKNISKALYGIAKYKVDNRYLNITDNYDDYEGEISAAYYFFDKLSDEQILSLALNYLNEYYLTHGKDETTKKRMKNLIKDLVTNDFEFDKYHQIERQKASEQSTAENSTKEEEERSSKYAKLRKIKKQQEVIDVTDKNSLNDKFHFEYLFNAPNTSELKQWFSEAKQEIEKEDNKNNEELSYKEQRQKEKEKEKEEKEFKKNPYKKMGIQTNKIVIVDPDYFVVDERKGQKLENAEEKKYKFYQQVEDVADASGIEYEILSPKVFSSSDVEKYNDLAKINDWVGEIMIHEDSKDDWDIIPSESEYIKYLPQKYNTDYFLFTGILEYKEEKKNVFGVLVLTAIYFPLFPFGLHYALSPAYSSYYYNLWYNLEQNKQVMANLIVLKKMKVNKANINSLMYDMFKQIQK